MARLALGDRTFFFLVLASLVWGSWLVFASGAADAPASVGLPNWWFLVIPVALVGLSSGLLATGVVLLSQWYRIARLGETDASGWGGTNPWTLGVTLSLIFAGVGLGIPGLLDSSAFGFGCLSPCYVVEVPTDRLATFGELVITGVAMFLVGIASLGVSILVRFRKPGTERVESSVSLKD